MLKGKVKTVKPRAVNTEVVVELPGGVEIVLIITEESHPPFNNMCCRNFETGMDIFANVKTQIAS